MALNDCRSIDNLDLLEANEALAAQALAVNTNLGWSPKTVDVNGRAIARGHPVGALVARVLVTLLHEMQQRNAQEGLAALSIDGDIGTL